MKRTHVFFVLAVLFLGIFLFAFTSLKNIEDTNPSITEIFLKNDPAYKRIGTEIPSLLLTDLITGETIDITKLTKPVVIESFSAACPSCVEGIKDYNLLFDKYGDSIVIVYLDFSAGDTEEEILEVKEQMDGRDWIWVAYSPEIQALYESLGIIGPEQSYLIKEGVVVYGDSLKYMEKLEEELKKTL